MMQVNNFELIKKPNIDNVLDTSITTEGKLLEYFTFQHNSDIIYELISVKVNNENKKIIIKYRLFYKNGENINRVKTLNISGFNENNQALINQIKQNEKILNKVHQLIKIKNIQSHADISARDFVEDDNSLIDILELIKMWLIN